MVIDIYEVSSRRSVPHFTTYITNLVTYITRMIVLKPQEFYQQVLSSPAV